MTRKDYILIATVLNSAIHEKQYDNQAGLPLFAIIVDKFANQLDIVELDFTPEEFRRMCYA